MTKNIANRGFTLVELLTVIAVIAVLAGVLIPVVGKVRESAGETAGRAQFSQWAQAFELFRQDYGYYPDFGNDLLINAGNKGGDRFYEALTGRVASGNDKGKRISSGNAGYEAGNIRAASFYSFGEGEVEEGTPVVIRDRFENADIVVMFDRTQNGIIELGGKDYPGNAGSLPEVTSARTGKEFRLTNDDFPTTGVRAGVIFYSAGYGNRLLMSWK